MARKQSLARLAFFILHLLVNIDEFLFDILRALPRTQLARPVWSSPNSMDRMGFPDPRLAYRSIIYQ
jgi:hypothetical protein